MRTWKSSVLLVVTICSVLAWAGQVSPVSVIPEPVRMQVNDGSFTLNARTVVTSAPEFLSQAHLLSRQLAGATGFALPVKERVESGAHAIRLQVGGFPQLGKEGYGLKVASDGITITAQTEAGIFYGCQTLRQLCDPGIYADRPLPNQPWLIPCVNITDYPTYQWRGMMLDVSRYFLDKAFVLRYLDIMALHKLNVLQLHLTDDCAWRVEIKAYPKLTTQGAFRGTGKDRVGGFYSQDDIREMVEYAAQRNITIVPEIELPAHAMAALVAYPDLGCTGKPHEMPTKHFISKDLFCAGKDTTWTFLEQVFTEVLDLFPSEYIHIGGDEASYDRWKECPDCLAKMKELGIEPGHEYELQGWMNLRMERFLLEHHRRMIGWDEILKCGVTPQAAIMTWHRPETAVQGAKRGNGVVMALTGHCYFDTPESKLPGELPGAGWLAPITLATAYNWEPRPEGLSHTEAQNILGAQGCLWTDMFLHQPWLADISVLNERRSELYVEYFSLPRMAALSEVVWTPQSQRNWDGFQARMARQYARYTASHFNFRVPVPNVTAQSTGSDWTVTVANPIEGGGIHYTIDGTAPTIYSSAYQGPVTVDNTDLFKAIAVAADGKHHSLVSGSPTILGTILPRVLATARLAPQVKSKPNIVYILADDLGYGDLSCYGQKKFITPNIDRLASDGMKFTQHYSGSTVCAPSRCALMTGFHTGHTQVRGNREVQPEGQAPMMPGTVTIPTLLRQAGYVSGMFGKWGLGAPGSDSDPMCFFDEFYGYNCQREAHNYYPNHLWHNRDKVLLDGKTYSHDLIMTAAKAFITDNRDTPFFCYMPVTIPHAAMHAPKALHDKYRQLFPQFDHAVGKYAGPEVANPVAAFPAMVEYLDHGVGQILDLLEELGIDDNTLVIFTSDNGPHQEGGHDPEFWDSNGPLRGLKRDLYEGGIRVPFLTRWPGKIKANTTSDHISAFWDMLPTFCAMAQVDSPENTDGISLLPTLLGQPQKTHDYLYWEFTERGGKQAIRQGDMKAVRLNVTKNPDSPIELYNLAEDVGETRNIAAQHPEIVEEMKGLFKQARTDSKTFPLFKK